MTTIKQIDIGVGIFVGAIIQFYNPQSYVWLVVLLMLIVWRWIEDKNGN